MYKQRIRHLIIALSAALTLAPMTAHHGSNIAAGFMGAGLGMMAGMALADHHHSHHYHHYEHEYYHHSPYRAMHAYSDDAPYHSYEYPYKKVYVYEDYRPYHHDFYDYPCSPICVHKNYCRPCYHSSFSFGFSV